MALLGPSGPEILLPDQFPFSSFSQKKDLNFWFRFLVFPLDFVSRCVTHGHAAHLLQNKGLSEFCGMSPLRPPAKNQPGSELIGQPVLGIWNPSISLFGTCCWTELNPEKSEAWVLLRDSRVCDRAF